MFFTILGVGGNAYCSLSSAIATVFFKLRSKNIWFWNTTQTFHFCSVSWRYSVPDSHTFLEGRVVVVNFRSPWEHRKWRFLGNDRSDWNLYPMGLRSTEVEESHLKMQNRLLLFFLLSFYFLWTNGIYTREKTAHTTPSATHMLTVCLLLVFPPLNAPLHLRAPSCIY